MEHALSTAIYVGLQWQVCRLVLLAAQGAEISILLEIFVAGHRINACMDLDESVAWGINVLMIRTHSLKLSGKKSCLDCTVIVCHLM